MGVGAEQCVIFFLTLVCCYCMFNSFFFLVYLFRITHTRTRRQASCKKRERGSVNTENSITYRLVRPPRRHNNSHRWTLETPPPRPGIGAAELAPRPEVVTSAAAACLPRSDVACGKDRVNSQTFVPMVNRRALEKILATSALWPPAVRCPLCLS